MFGQLGRCGSGGSKPGRRCGVGDGRKDCALSKCATGWDACDVKVLPCCELSVPLFIWDLVTSQDVATVRCCSTEAAGPTSGGFSFYLAVI